MKEKHTRKAIERAIDEELSQIVENGDVPPDGDMDSQEERRVTARKEVLVGCSGFLDDEGKEQCPLGNNIDLHDTNEDD